MKKINLFLVGQKIFSNSEEAFLLNKKSYFGENVDGKIVYSLCEALFLIEENKATVLSKKKKLSFNDLIKKFVRYDSRLMVKYVVFKDLRKKGYIVKTALKYGADFRVYEKGKKPGKEHAKWIVFCDSESKKINWVDFSARNRIANSVKKKLLIAIVDEEGDITYYEVSWVKP
ncbi:MAG: tRNA-intron lyase [Candidatus Pacearchaeota archaeon]|nr:MAG: tRNA-intron lyase [Candidatus Pacearchaeota archaeon]